MKQIVSALKRLASGVAYQVSKRVLEDVATRNKHSKAEFKSDPDASGYGIYDLAHVPVKDLPAVPRDTGRTESIQRAMDEGKELPPVRASWDGKEWGIDDGNHRIDVARKRGFELIPVLAERWKPRGGKAPAFAPGVQVVKKS